MESNYKNRENAGGIFGNCEEVEGTSYGNHEEAGIILENREDAGGIFGNREDAGGIFENHEDAGGIFGNREDAGGILGNREDAGGIFGNREDAGGIFGNREDAGGILGNREDDCNIFGKCEDAGGIFGNRENAGGIFGNRQDTGGIFGNRQDAGGILGNREDAGDIFGKREDAGGIFGNRQDAGDIFVNREDAGGIFGNCQDAGGMFGNREDAGGIFGSHEPVLGRAETLGVVGVGHQVRDMMGAVSAAAMEGPSWLLAMLYCVSTSLATGLLLGHLGAGLAEAGQCEEAVGGGGVRGLAWWADLAAYTLLYPALITTTGSVSALLSVPVLANVFAILLLASGALAHCPTTAYQVLAGVGQARLATQCLLVTLLPAPDTLITAVSLTMVAEALCDGIGAVLSVALMASSPVAVAATSAVLTAISLAAYLPIYRYYQRSAETGLPAGNFAAPMTPVVDMLRASGRQLAGTFIASTALLLPVLAWRELHYSELTNQPYTVVASLVWHGALLNLCHARLLGTKGTYWLCALTAVLVCLPDMPAPVLAYTASTLVKSTVLVLCAATFYFYVPVGSRPLAVVIWHLYITLLALLTRGVVSGATAIHLPLLDQLGGLCFVMALAALFIAVPAISSTYHSY